MRLIYIGKDSRLPFRYNMVYDAQTWLTSDRLAVYEPRSEETVVYGSLEDFFKDWRRPNKGD